MVLQRFFIALVPPPEIQTSVNEIKHYFAEHYGSCKALNSPPHITLQAPFEWSDELGELTEGLRQFALERMGGVIALRNFGAFPPNVIYVDVTQTPYIMLLQRDLSAFMKTTYRVADRRYPNFCPHMTVAFRDLTKAAFHQAWPKISQKPFKADFIAQELALLRHDGQRWQINQTYPLLPVSQKP
ncbi:MAG: 2'-5' RNA ligase family protein [Cyanobacteria bacterium P01_B01_bin.77]